MGAFLKRRSSDEFDDYAKDIMDDDMDFFEDEGLNTEPKPEDGETQDIPDDIQQ